MISCALGGTRCLAGPVTLDDLRRLGDNLAQEGDSFGGYLFKTAAYHLTDDPQLKKRLGLEVVGLCTQARRYPESERMLAALAADFPQAGAFHDSLAFAYGYSLLLDGEFGRSDIYLRPLQKVPGFKDRALFLRAYDQLQENDERAARPLLERIEPGNFRYPDSLASLLQVVRQGPRFHRRHKAAAVLLSAALPGLGQEYCGHHFDALHSLIYNALFGGACYTAWKYGFSDRSPGHREIALPVFTTAASAVFYVVNLWNAANCAGRYNRYQEMRYHQDLVQRFELVRREREYFLQGDPPSESGGR
jgi:hypothetical protein